MSTVTTPAATPARTSQPSLPFPLMLPDAELLWARRTPTEDGEFRIRFAWYEELMARLRFPDPLRELTRRLAFATFAGNRGLVFCRERVYDLSRSEYFARRP